MTTPNEPVTPETPQPETPTVQPATPPAPTPAAQSPSGTPGLNELITAIQGMPERVVDSLRESMQSSSKPAATPSETPKPVAEQSPTVPNKKSFAQRWFG